VTRDGVCRKENAGQDPNIALVPKRYAWSIACHIKSLLKPVVM
jgi:hypothetical protein